MVGNHPIYDLTVAGNQELRISSCLEISGTHHGWKSFQIWSQDLAMTGNHPRSIIRGLDPLNSCNIYRMSTRFGAKTQFGAKHIWLNKRPHICGMGHLSGSNHFQSLFINLVDKVSCQDKLRSKP